MRKITIPEIVDRIRQSFLSRAEGLPILKVWLLPETSNILAKDHSQSDLFNRLSTLLPLGAKSAVIDDIQVSGASHLDELRLIADQALSGHFALLGMAGLGFGNPVNWHLEPTSGRISPLVPWKQLDSLDPSRTGDKKVVWELNRHQHLVALGLAFQYSGDDRYANGISEHITSWIQANPVGRGINWVSSLEIAFRCINWLWSLSLIRHWNQWATLPLSEYAESFYAQASHIEKYLSTYTSPNTHLTGEALALYYLGTCLPELKRSEHWKKLGRTILLQQLDRQVHPDGVYFEQSTWYHRYTTEFYLHFSILAKRAADPLPLRVNERLEALLDHLMWITRPDGTSPYLGDDDGGNLISLDRRRHNDWRSFLSHGAVLFQRGDYKHVSNVCAIETPWLLGENACTEYRKLRDRLPAPLSHAFVNGGIYVMRSGWNRDSHYLLFDCGPHGTMNCGHAHADALSFELAGLGTTFLIDPGTFTYTRGDGNQDLYRSTEMHNTLTVDGLSSSVPSGPFKWDHIANTTTHCWHDHPVFTFVEAAHDGYRRLHDPVTHKRTVMFVHREYWLLLDTVIASAGHHIEVHYQMAPDVDAMVDHRTRTLTAVSQSASLDIIYIDTNGKWSVRENMVSPCYGDTVPAKHAAYSIDTTGAVSMLSVLYPRASGVSSPVIRDVKPATGKGIELENTLYRDVVLWEALSAPDADIQSTDYEWVCLRYTARTNSLARAILLHGKYIRANRMIISADLSVDYMVVNVGDNEIDIDVSPPASVHIRAPKSIIKITVNGKKQVVSEVAIADNIDIHVVNSDGNTSHNRVCRHVRH